jgi:hypothetical protein
MKPSPRTSHLYKIHFNIRVELGYNVMKETEYFV